MLVAQFVSKFASTNLINCAIVRGLVELFCGTLPHLDSSFLWLATGSQFHVHIQAQVASMAFMRTCLFIALQAVPLLAEPAKISVLFDEGPGLYLGGEDDAKPAALKILSDGEIRIVDLLGKELKVVLKDELGNSKMSYPVKDWAKHFHETALFIEDGLKKKLPVLVHCKVGCKGGGSVIVGYLMQNKGMSFQAAYDLVKEARPCVDQIYKPENKMFLDGLMDLKKEIDEMNQEL